MIDKEPRLIANRWQCPDGTILQSKHRYDYVTHKDALTGDECFVDGGLFGVIRTSGNLRDLCVYSNDPHEVQREFFHWGTRGVDGKQPLVFIAAKNMTTEHIESCIKTQDRLAPEIMDLFLNELAYRKELNALHTNEEHEDTALYYTES